MPAPPTDKGGTWWVEIIYSEINILQLNYPKVVQSATKPATGQRFTYFVSGVEGPWNTKQKAVQAAHNYSGIVNQGGVGSGGGGGTGTLGDIGNFFHRLSEKATWVRVAEVGLGGILLWVGLHASTQGSAAKSAARSASKPVTKSVKRAAKTTVRVAAPEVTPGVRVASARGKARARHPKRTYIHHVKGR